MQFVDLLSEHQKLFRNDLNSIVFDFIKRGQVHDNDKINNPIIYQTYKKHFPNLKRIPFGTSEYYNFEEEHFNEAHMLHAQNGHHFYSTKNETTVPNLIDFIEAIVDINASNKQYTTEYNIDEVMKSIKSKGIFDITLESLTRETIKYINESES